MPVLTYYDILDIPNHSSPLRIKCAWEASRKGEIERKAYEGLMDPGQKSQLDNFLHGVRSPDVLQVGYGDKTVLEKGGWISCKELSFSEDVWPFFSTFSPEAEKVVIGCKRRKIDRFVELYVMPGTRDMRPEKTNTENLNLVLVPMSAGPAKALQDDDYTTLRNAVASVLPVHSRPFIGKIAAFARTVPPRVKDLSVLDQLDYEIFGEHKNLVMDTVRKFLLDRGFFMMN